MAVGKADALPGAMRMHTRKQRPYRPHSGVGVIYLFTVVPLAAFYGRPPRFLFAGICRLYMAPVALMVHDLERYSELRADPAREVTHAFIGVFEPELYRRFIFLAVTVHHHG